MRACRNAIEFNSIPSLRRLIPNGYDGLKLYVKIGVPNASSVDVEACRKVFPYGQATFEARRRTLRVLSCALHVPGCAKLRQARQTAVQRI